MILNFMAMFFRSNEIIELWLIVKNPFFYILSFYDSGCANGNDEMVPNKDGGPSISIEEGSIKRLG